MIPQQTYQHPLHPRWHFLINHLPCELTPINPSLLIHPPFAHLPPTQDLCPQEQQLYLDCSFKAYKSQFGSTTSRCLKSKQLQVLLDSKVDMQHLPQSGLLFQRKSTSSYKIIEVSISPKQVSQTNPQQLSQVNPGVLGCEALSQLPKNWLLYTWRGLAFLKLSLAQFSQIFRQSLLLGFRDVQQTLHQEQGQNGVVELISWDHNTVAQGQQAGLSTQDWQQLIFDSFPQSHPKHPNPLPSNATHIYWPCVVLRPVADPNALVPHLLKCKSTRQPSFDSHCQSQAQMFSLILQQVIKSKDVSVQRQGCVVENDVKPEEQFRDPKQAFLVKLLGTNRVLSAQKLVAWSVLGSRVTECYGSHANILHQISRYMECLYKFKKLEQAQATQANCLGRFCQYKDSQYGRTPALVLRYERNRADRKALLRMLGKANSGLKWVNQSRLQLNLALAPLQTHEISQFFDEQTTGTCELQSQNSQQTVFVCPDCKYQAKSKEQPVQCQKCSLFWQCYCQKEQNHTNKQQGKQQDKQQSKQQNNTNTRKHTNTILDKRTKQSCPLCSPCSLCYSKMGKDALQSITCIKCSGRFHRQCAQLSLPTNRPLSSQFLCISCCCCEYCGRSLWGQSRVSIYQVLVCDGCRKQQSRGQICGVCHRGNTRQSSKRCTNQACGKAVHQHCDALIPAYPHLKFYKCPACRLLMRRQLLKLLIMELRSFDEMQYYYEPCFEQIPKYEAIVDTPSCVMLMSDRVSDGAYDSHPIAKIKADFTRIIENALSFNEAKSDPFYRAKVLYIVGCLFIEKVGPWVQVEEVELMRGQGRRVFQEKVNDFYLELKKHYLAYLLNYPGGRSLLQLEYDSQDTSQESSDYFYFKFVSSELIREQLAKARLSLRLQKSQEKLEQLLGQPRTKATVYSPFSNPTCYYHPQDNFPVLYQCSLCWETYCCTRRCNRHHPPSQITFACACTDHPADSQLLLEQTAHRLGYSVCELTQFYEHCWKCVQQQLGERLCYLCSGFCCYGYRQCRDCRRYYHLRCGIRASNLSEERLAEADQLISEHCPSCWNEQYAQRWTEVLLQWSQERVHKMNKVSHYLPIFDSILKSEGMQTNNTDLVQMLYRSYPQLLPKEDFCNFILSTVDGIPMLDLFTDCLQARLRLAQHQLQHPTTHPNPTYQTLPNPTLSNPTLPQPKGVLTILAELESPTTESQTTSQGSQRGKGEYERGWLLKKSLDELKVLAQQELTSRQGVSLNIEHWANALSYHEPLEQADKLVVADYLAYCSYRPAPPSTHHSILAHSTVLPLTSPKHFNSDYSRMEQSRMEYYRVKVERIYEYLRCFIMRVLNQNQRYWRRGNTCVLQYGEDRWHCLKKYNNCSYQFEVAREHAGWYFAVNGQRTGVSDVAELIACLQQHNPNIHDFQSLSDFLGLDLSPGTTTSYQLARLLLQHPMGQMTRRERSQFLSQYIASSINSQQQSIGLPRSAHSQQPHPTKANNTGSHKIYYKQKRIPEPGPLKQSQSKLDIKITEADLKRDLGIVQQLLPQDINSLAAQPPLDCLYVTVSAIDRLGVFTQHPIPAHTKVIEYVGEVLSEAAADLRERKSKQGCYMFALQAQDKRYEVVDASFMGNMSRYLNHSCDANCRTARVKDASKTKIVVYTAREVDANQELTFDYLFKVESKQPMTCRCQSPNCQGRIN